MKRLFVIAVFLAFVTALFYFMVKHTNVQTEKHGYDSMIVQKVSPSFRASNRNGILQNLERRGPLNLSEEQGRQLDELFAEYDVRRDEIFKRWRDQNPKAKSYIPFSAEGESELVIELDRAAIRTLSSSQLKKLYCLEYSMTGWDFVFFAEVQKELKLSPTQQTQIKDLQMERVKVRQDLNREWMKADEAGRRDLEEKAKAIKADFESRLLAVLTTQQMLVRKKLLGSAD